jgi:rRNA maturation endonuclease Nob1
MNFRAYRLELSQKVERKKEYKCTDCKQVNLKKDNGQITVGFCKKCGHPLWND